MSAPHEDTPLLGSTSPTQTAGGNLNEDDACTSQGNASVAQTMTNMAKACLGPGCLVLPFAARQGGLWLHTFGLLAMALWNVYTMQRLCQCLDYLPPKKSANPLAHTDATTAQSSPRHPPEGTAMFGQVMWYATGARGLWALDFLMLSFLLGILITYINAMRSFLKDTPLTTKNDILDALLLVAIMGPLASVPHLGYLANASALGLAVLAISFLVFLLYGLAGEPQELQSTHSFSSLSWYPQDGLWGVSHWFGCVVFSFGVAPLTYNFRSSMADPSKMVPAAWYTLLGVAGANMIVGIGFWILYPTIKGDLIQELPTTGILPTVTRLAMVLVVLTTTPLLIVPCGELLEGKAAELMTDFSPQTCRILFRIGISLIGVAVSLYVPGFVDVLSFVGCCCVACLGFVIPPFLHGVLSHKARQQFRKSRKEDTMSSFSISPLCAPVEYNDSNSEESASFDEQSYKVQMALDIVMFVWGIFATVISTTYTFRQLSLVGG